MKLFKKKTETLEEKRGRIKHQQQMQRSQKYRERESQRERSEKQIKRVKRQTKQSKKETLKTVKRRTKKVSGFLMDVSERFEESQITPEVKRKPAKKKPVKKEIDIMDIMMG